MWAAPVERDAPAPARPARQHRASAPETPSLPARAEAYSRRNTEGSPIIVNETFMERLRRRSAGLLGLPTPPHDTRSTDQKHVDELFDTLKQRKAPARTPSAVLLLCREWRAGRFCGVDDRSFFERVMPILLSVDVQLRKRLLPARLRCYHHWSQRRRLYLIQGKRGLRRLLESLRDGGSRVLLREF